MEPYKQKSMIQIKIERLSYNLFQAIGNDDFKVNGWGFDIQGALENYKEHYKMLYNKIIVDYKWS
jgi:hypothetical protein